MLSHRNNVSADSEQPNTRRKIIGRRTCKSKKSTIGALGVFSLIVCCTLWLIGPWGQFPLNDDWTYTANVVKTIASGKFTVASGQHAYGIPQVLAGVAITAPGDEPFLRLRWIGILSGILSSMLLTTLSLRAVKVNNSYCYLAGLVSAFFFLPALQTSMSFMTDMPALLLWILSLWSMATFLEKRSFATWFLAISTNSIAVSERQSAFLIPLAAMIAETHRLVFQRERRQIPQALTRYFALLLFALPWLALQLWWNKISPTGTGNFNLSFSLEFFVRLFQFGVHFGWLALPFCFFSRIPWRALPPRSKQILGFSVGSACYGFILSAGPAWFSRGEFPLPPYFGNLLHDVGILPEVLFGFNEKIFPDWFKLTLLATGCWGGVQILKGFALLCEERDSSALKKIILFASALYLIAICFQTVSFDRYAIPAVPLCLMCLFRVCRMDVGLSRKRFFGVILASTLYAAFAITLVADYFRWNEARWEAIRHAHSIGIPKDQLWAGYEYLGWYDMLEFWLRRRPVPFQVAPTRFPDTEVLKAFNYPSYWGRSERTMYLLRYP